MGRDIIIFRSEDSEAKLSTIHREASFGRPVLIVDGQYYRPDDDLPSRLLAREMVDLFLLGGKLETGTWGRRSKRAIIMAEKFR